MRDYRCLQGCCLDVLPTLGLADAVVTDPPYGLKFMGKGWDHGVPGELYWRAVMAAMKPGAHLLAFGGTRTYHRLMVGIEDAGFELRDCIMWVYGSGFPKSMDVSKAIDKAAGAQREVLGEIPDRWTGKGNALNFKTDRPQDTVTVHGGPATAQAATWQGWGTAIKPSWEPVIVARKPLKGTVAANVLAHGTGALNIDGCRIQLNGGYKCKANGRPSQTGLGDRYDPETANQPDTLGRWPANLIHDGSEEVVGLFPDKAGAVAPVTRQGSKFRDGATFHGDSGSAARFFYCAKASRADRGEGNHHPTVKPTELMRYLVRLVTPPGGTVLDPFTGSGSTGKAAVLEGFKFVGIERDTEHGYIDIARARLAHAVGLRDA